MAPHKRRNPTRGRRASRSERLAGSIALEGKLATLELRQVVAVCDGRRLLGHLAGVDGFWRAWREDGIPLGIFPRWDEARFAVIKAGRSVP